jgi:hypothetical protein
LGYRKRRRAPHGYNQSRGLSFSMFSAASALQAEEPPRMECVAVSQR